MDHGDKDDRRRRRVTLKDVATATGVSVATVSRAINGSTHPVSEDQRAHILRVSTELGYRANVAAQSLARGRTSTIVVVLDDIRDPALAAVATGVIDQAAGSRWMVTVAAGASSAEDEVAVIARLRQQRPAGMILAGSRFHETAIRERLVVELGRYEDSGGTVVVVGPNDLPFSFCEVLYRDGASDLAAVLGADGYNSPLLLGPVASDVAAQLWLGGVREGFAAHGVAVPDERVFHVPLGRDEGYDFVSRSRELMLRTADVILCSHDSIAIGVMSALRQRGSIVPDDYAVAGFLGLSDGLMTTPALTSATAPLAEAGAAAFLCATGALAAPPSYPMRVRSGESTARPEIPNACASESPRMM